MLLRCRYLVRVTISRRIADVTKEREIWVHSYRMPPDSNNSIKMEVGIEDCLHIEFEYNKSKCVLAPYLALPSLLPSLCLLASLSPSLGLFTSLFTYLPSSFTSPPLAVPSRLPHRR